MGLPVFSRPLLSAWLQQGLEGVSVAPSGALSVSVGSGPPDVGWVGTPGQPGAAFIPYTVLIPMDATKHFADTLTDDTGDWQVPYQVRTNGGVAGQAEFVANMVRQQISDVMPPPKLVLELNGLWAITRAFTSTIGGIVVDNNVNPPLWSVTDVLTLWVSRSKQRS